MERYLESSKLEGIELSDTLLAMFDLFDLKGWDSERCIEFVKEMYGHNRPSVEDELEAQMEEISEFGRSDEVKKTYSALHSVEYCPETKQEKLEQYLEEWPLENENSLRSNCLICKVSAVIGEHGGLQIELPREVVDELQVEPGESIEFCIGDAMISLWKHLPVK